VLEAHDDGVIDTNIELIAKMPEDFKYHILNKFNFEVLKDPPVDEAERLAKDFEEFYQNEVIDKGLQGMVDKSQLWKSPLQNYSKIVE